MKGNLSREEQEELSAKLAAMGVNMTWIGGFSELDFEISSTNANTYTACRYVKYLSLPTGHIHPHPFIIGNPTAPPSLPPLQDLVSSTAYSKNPPIMPAQKWTDKQDVQLLQFMYFDPAARQTYAYYATVGEQMGFPKGTIQ